MPCLASSMLYFPWPGVSWPIVALLSACMCHIDLKILSLKNKIICKSNQAKLHFSKLEICFGLVFFFNSAADIDTNDIGLASFKITAFFKLSNITYISIFFFHWIFLTFILWQKSAFWLHSTLYVCSLAPVNAVSLIYISVTSFTSNDNWTSHFRVSTTEFQLFSKCHC